MSASFYQFGLKILRILFPIAGIIAIFYLNSWEALLTTFSSFSISRTLAVSLISVLTGVLSGVRLGFLTGNSIKLKEAIHLSFISQALNSFLPVKAGEVYKIFKLKARLNSVTLASSVVLWERLIDLTLMAIIGLILIGAKTLQFFIIISIGLWTAIVLTIVCEKRIQKIIQSLSPKIAAAYSLFTNSCREKMSWHFLFSATWRSLVIFMSAFCVTYMTITYIAGIKTEIFSIAFCFLTSMVCIAAPIAPGGVGLFEIAVSETIVSMGVPSEQAMAVALLLHALLLVPFVTGFCFLLIVDNGILSRTKIIS